MVLLFSIILQHLLLRSIEHGIRIRPTIVSHTKVTHLEDVNGGLVDGADNSAAGVDCVADCSHDYCSSTRVQPCQKAHGTSQFRMLVVVESLLEVKTRRTMPWCSSSCCTMAGIPEPVTCIRFDG